MGNIKSSGQKVILRCEGCFTTTILILNTLDFKFKEKIPSKTCLYCGAAKYTIHGRDSYSIIGEAHEDVSCRKCTQFNLAYLGNEIYFCINCNEFFSNN